MFISNENMVLLAFLPLLAGIVLQLLLGRWLGARQKGVLALASSLPALGAVVAAFARVAAAGAIHFNAAPWDGPLALVFHVDALSLMFALMGTGLGAIVLLYSIGYMAHEKGTTRFYCFMLTFITGMVGLVYFANLFGAYLCWEAMGLCSFSLVGFWYDQPAAVAGARKVLLMTHLAGYGLLAAILLIFSRTGSSLWTDPGVAQAFTSGVFTLMLVALLAKSVQFPLHTWIPEAMNAPTPVSALLHAACYVKAGVYLAARMHSFGPWQTSWSLMLMWLGTVTMVVGVAYAMIQHDLKRMLAFHTVSQIGYIITGIGLGTPLGIAAGLLHCLNHSLFKGGLFLAAGSVQHAAGTRDMNQLGGLARRMPRTAVVWFISVSSMMGVPFLSGFASKWLLYTAALESGQVVPALAAWVVSVGTVFSCVKATSSVFLGPTTTATREAHEAPPTMQWALGLFAFGSLVLGLAPQLAINFIINPVLPLFGMATVQVSWFGLTPAAGSWWTGGGLAMGLVSASVGVVLFVLAGVSRAKVFAMNQQVALAGGGGVGVFSGGERLSGPSRLPASEFSVILKQHWAPLYKATNVDGFYLGVWRALEAISSRVRAALAWAESSLFSWLVVLAVAVFCALRGISMPLPLTGAVAESPVLLPAVSAAIAGAALILAALAIRSLRSQLPLLVGTVGCAVAAAILPQPVARLALLELASLAAVALLWRHAPRKAAWIFATVVLLSAASLVGGQFMLSVGALNEARALLMTGFVLKLALAPLLLWLPAVAEVTPAIALGAIIAVVDVVAFGELTMVAGEHPEFLQPAGLWIAIALAGALIASLAMLTERNMKRLLALSTVEDMGFLLLGLVASTQIGVRGALIGVASHALAKALLFIALASPEADGTLSNNATGLATRYPFSAAAFIAGSIAMLGVPPMLGFAGRWRLYLSASNIDHRLLAGFVACSMLSLIAYVLTIVRTWWGAWSGEEDVVRTPEPLLLRFVIVALIALLILGGLYPQAALNLAGGAL